MPLRRLKLLAILVPLAFLGLIEVLRHAVYADILHVGPGAAVVAAVVVAGVAAFAQALFGLIERAQARLAERNHELLALHQAGLAISGELHLEEVLQRIVEQARELVGARYGALSLVDEGGALEAFLTSGLTDEQRARIGPLPRGHGILGVVLREGQRLRLADLSRDPRSVGFPPNHPPMRSLLAVPVVSHGQVLGNLYLTEKTGGAIFSQDDEETLARFATQAAVAIENARLHRRVRELAITEERERLAREMHDSLAQVLGYVNTKAEAAAELLRSGQSDRAAGHLSQLAEAARSAYSDVREAILALRTTLGEEQRLTDALRAFIQSWQEQSGIPAELRTDVDDTSLGLPPAAELQLLRIMQEALANVRKHSGATRVRVRITEVDGAVQAVVEDNGTGFDPAAPAPRTFPRFGLATMRERAEAVGGRLTIESTPGRGTRVIATIPRELAGYLAQGGANARAHR